MAWIAAMRRSLAVSMSAGVVNLPRLIRNAPSWREAGRPNSNPTPRATRQDGEKELVIFREEAAEIRGVAFTNGLELPTAILAIEATEF